MTTPCVSGKCGWAGQHHHHDDEVNGLHVTCTHDRLDPRFHGGCDADANIKIMDSGVIQGPDDRQMDGFLDALVNKLCPINGPVDPDTGLIEYDPELAEEQCMMHHDHSIKQEEL